MMIQMLGVIRTRAPKVVLVAKALAGWAALVEPAAVLTAQIWVVQVGWAALAA